MSSFKKLILDNGLTVLLFNDNNKNRTIASLYIKAGGLDNHFIYDGKEYTQEYGIAHLLEHYLIEKSIHGNILRYFDNEYITSNGNTNSFTTCFYISTVHDFEENFIKLLDIVNKPSFNKDDINDIKKPIISEINRALDEPNREYNEYANSCCLKNISFNKTLGTIEGINKISINDIKTFHKAFYQPSNQLLLVSGRFDEKKLLDIIEDKYKSFSKNHKEFKRLLPKEPYKIVRERGEFKSKDLDEIIDISFKIDTSKLSPCDRYKMNYYLKYALYNNFSDKSDLFKIIREKEISLYSVEYSSYMIQNTDLLIIELTLYTNKYDEGEKLLMDRINNLHHDEKSYKNYSNFELIEYINDYEIIHNQASDYYSIMINYGFEDDNHLKTIKKLNYKECVEFINKLDLSNYSIVKRIKGE